MNDLVMLCREVNKRTGEIMVYEINMPVTDRNLSNMKLRVRLNPELRCFVTERRLWEGAEKKDIYRLLKRRTLTEDSINRFRGIAEL